MLFQRLEAVLKSLVGTNNVSGYISDLLSKSEQNIAVTHKQTLGHVAQQFVRHMQPGVEAADDAPEDLKRAWVCFSFKVGMTDAEHESLRQVLTAVVQDRNELIHHLFHRFAIDSPEGAAEAIIHLDQQHIDTLAAWRRVKDIAEFIQEAREIFAAFFASKQYEQYLAFHLIHGREVSAILSQYAQEKGDADGWADLSGAGKQLSLKVQEELTKIKAHYNKRSLKELLEDVAWYETCEETTAKGGVRVLYRTKMTWVRQDET